MKNATHMTLSGYETCDEPTYIAVEIEPRGPVIGDPPTPLARRPRAPMFRAVVATAHMYETHVATEWTPYAGVAELEGRALESDLRWASDPRAEAS